MFTGRRIRRDVLAGATAALASMVLVTTGGIAPAWAGPATNGGERFVAQAVHTAENSQTPMCLVQGALLYPLFIGFVFVTNPSVISTALPNYWIGGKDSEGRSFPGVLATCGLP